MILTDSHFIQLILALLLGVALFVGAYVTPQRYVVSFLVLMIPFQVIDSRYGSLNLVITYLIGTAFLLKGRIKRWPLLWAVILIMIAYLASMSQTLGQTYFDHVIYLLSITANFVVFYIVYNFCIQEQDYKFSIQLFVWVAGAVAVFFTFSAVIGLDQFAFMGIQELSFKGNVEDVDELQRLLGPFNAPGTNAEFLAMQILLLGYVLMHERIRWRQFVLLGLLVANFAFLVGTGSRGGFVALVVGVFLLVLNFRKQLGGRRLVGIGLATLLLTVAAVTAVKFSEYNNVLFERLGETEFEGFVPDTRTGPFEMAMARIPENPFLGHGPRIRLIQEEERQIRNYQPFGGYPHNLIFFLLYTVGIIGFLAYLVFFVALFRRWWVSRNPTTPEPILNGIPRLAMVLFLVFVASQMRIEFLRSLLHDYQNYLFALWAMLLALTDIAREKSGSKWLTREGQDDMSGSVSSEDARILKPKGSKSLLTRQTS